MSKQNVKAFHSFLFALLTACVLPAVAQHRIVTAGSAITEAVCALGSGHQIVASDRTSLYPVEIQKLPSIGYRSGINAEGILSLKPTIVIAERDYVSEAVLEQLAASRITLVIVEQRKGYDDTKKYITQIGTALGRDAEAKKLIASIDKQMDDAKALLRQTATRPKVLCIYNRGTATISMAGNNTFGDIVNYVGAVSAIANIDGYKPLNTEALIAANPDYLLMVDTGFESLGGLDGVLKVAGVAQTTAGKKKQIIAIDSLKLTNFGPRFGEAVKELVLLLHPELNVKP